MNSSVFGSITQVLKGLLHKKSLQVQDQRNVTLHFIKTGFVSSILFMAAIVLLHTENPQAVGHWSMILKAAVIYLERMPSHLIWRIGNLQEICIYTSRRNRAN